MYVCVKKVLFLLRSSNGKRSEKVKLTKPKASACLFDTLNIFTVMWKSRRALLVSYFFQNTHSYNNHRFSLGRSCANVMSSCLHVLDSEGNMSHPFALETPSCSSTVHTTIIDKTLIIYSYFLYCDEYDHCYATVR